MPILAKRADAADSATDRSPALMAAAVFLVFAVYYGFCLYPGLGGEMNAGDSVKFQILGHTSIMVHGPGYPLVLLLGSLVRALDLPLEPWWVMSFALSAVPGAVANAVAFLIVRRLTDSSVLGFAAALLLGSARLMAIQSTEAEVYALNIAFVLTTLYLLLLFSQTRRPGFFVAACAVYALSFGNHLMMVMLLPLFAWLTVQHHRIVVRRGIILAVLGFIVLGAGQYLFLAYVAHDPATSYSEYMPLPPSVGELIGYIAGLRFSGMYGSGFSSTRNLVALLPTFSSAHPWISLPLIGLGLGLFFLGWNRKDAGWRGIALLVGAAACFLPFVIGYGAFDIRAFHLPVLALLLLAAVASLGWALRSRPAALRGVAALLLLVGLVRAGQTAVDLRDRSSPLAGVKAAVEALVAQSPVPEPFVAMGYEVRMAALYHELRGELPQGAVYRLVWRMPAQVNTQSVVGGIVMQPNGFPLIRGILERRPDMSCRVGRLVRRDRMSWRAYSFRCAGSGGPAVPKRV